jgi:hypothetical protein
MRLRHRVVLGLLTAAMAVPAPANRWLPPYAGVALVVLVPRGRYWSSQLWSDSPPSTARFWPVT